MMADLGADVVKVEPPTGDFYRGRLASQRGAGLNYNFEFENRGKRSITLDLTQPGASEVVKRLCEGADVFVTNLVSERVKRYDLGYDELRRRNSRLVYTSITGYGARGPEADTPGFDASSFWARSGIMGMIGNPDQAPIVNRGGQGDHATTLAALAAILAALRQRDRPVSRSLSMLRCNASASGRSPAISSSSLAACPRGRTRTVPSRASSPGTLTAPATGAG